MPAPFYLGEPMCDNYLLYGDNVASNGSVKTILSTKKFKKRKKYCTSIKNNNYFDGLYATIVYNFQIQIMRSLIEQ